MMELCHPLEDADSWNAHIVDSHHQPDDKHRQLRHHKHKDDNKLSTAQLVEEEKEQEFLQLQRDEQKQEAKEARHKQKKHAKLLDNLWGRSNDIAQETVHGLMIDAGSTGSRMHVYEWEPRVLCSREDIEQAVAGNKLSFPGTQSRWTDRLRPGLASFATIPDDDEMQQAVSDYLKPLLDFALAVLSSKQDHIREYPIFLRGTAGLRVLEPADRARVMKAVRNLFHNKTYCPFAFVDEQARVLSGEEEAIFDWTGVNFLLGDLIDASQGAGTVVEPRLTHGALDLGGASTQIGFYEPNEDVMSNLFKLQIGQAKHWNLYAHSFLFYGMNEAIDRFHALLTAGKTSQERLIDGVYNPCMPGGGTKMMIRTNIHFQDKAGGSDETWEYKQDYPSGNGYYQAMLINNEKGGDPKMCFENVKALLHLEKNSWCNFVHKGDCSFAGIYQPEMPSQSSSPNFGDMVAFSNYYHVWNFLHLPERATIAQLKNATEYVCSLSHDDLVAFNNGIIDDSELDSYCFRSVYVYQLLHSGYGFKLEDTIRATNVIHGQKVGWALGAMLYEINAMGWKYVEGKQNFIATTDQDDKIAYEFYVLAVIVIVIIVSSLVVLLRQRSRTMKCCGSQYEPLKDASIEIEWYEFSAQAK